MSFVVGLKLDYKGALAPGTRGAFAPGVGIEDFASGVETFAEAVVFSCCSVVFFCVLQHSHQSQPVKFNMPRKIPERLIVYFIYFLYILYPCFYALGAIGVAVLGTNGGV